MTENTKVNLSKTDRLILNALSNDGRISNVMLAEKVNLSESSCLRRVKNLEDRGVIERYSMVLNKESLGITGTVFIEVTLNSQNQEDLQAFENAVLSNVKIMECHLMSGDFDYLIRVPVTDLADYERLHRNVLSKLPSVSRIKSSFSLRAITEKINPFL